MTEEEYLHHYFNKVTTLTAVCRTTSSWAHGDYPELEVGKTYHVTYIGVLRSCTRIMLEGCGKQEYNSNCFDLYEHGESLGTKYMNDHRFWAPYLREDVEYTDEIEALAIPAHLREIEQGYQVKILLAVESGSRAWGFESADSDWDVRFIYVHKPEWYFKVEEQRDVIEHLYEDDVDLVGWELRKALALFRRSNPSLFEWFNSPKVYYVNNEFARRIHEVEKDYFNPVKTMYHYNHIYNKHNERYLQKEDCDMKRFLYYLRGILACKWIESNNTLPPVSFKELLDATVEDGTIKEKIVELLRIKKSGEEHNMHVVDDSLMDFARQWADYYNKMIGSFRPELQKASTDALDGILYDMVNDNA